MAKPQDDHSPINPAQSAYPTPVKGPLSDDHSAYAKPVKFAGEDPDNHLRIYYMIFLIMVIVAFIMVIKALSGGNFFF
jgi:hypothetical protein